MNKIDQILLDILKTKPFVKYISYKTHIYYNDYDIYLKWDSDYSEIFCYVNDFLQKERVSQDVYQEYQKYCQILILSIDVKKDLRNKKLKRIGDENL